MKSLKKPGFNLTLDTIKAPALGLGALLILAGLGSWLINGFDTPTRILLAAGILLIGVFVAIDPEEEDYPTLDAGPEELLIRKEQEERFMRLLNQLPVPHRAVLLLHFVEDFSLEEISRITDTPTGTVKSRLHYAKKALRALLEENV